MEATLVELDLDQVDSSGRLMGEGRSVGCHLSDVLNWAKANSGETPQETGNPLFITMGFLFEVLLEKAWKVLGAMMRHDRSKVVRPTEIQCDGIYMSPDGLDPATSTIGEPTLEEYKLTFGSLGRLTGFKADKGDCCGDPERYLNEHRRWWLVQIKSYARALGLLRARLIIMFVNGDYTFKEPLGGPRIVPIEIEFTQEELDANWQRVLEWKQLMEAEAQ